MHPFFVYLIKSSLSIALFYIVFKLAVSRDKIHTINRFVLLAILISSALLPLADITVLQEAELIPTVEVLREFIAAPVFDVPAISEPVQTIIETKSISINWYLVFYLSIISLLVVRLLNSIIRVVQILKGAKKQSFQKVILAVVKDFIQPFSFFKNIVISEKDYTENKEIVVAHEYAHIKHLHAIDLIVCELFTAIHWFNPFMWFLRRDLKLIHEFQADQAVLNNGIDAIKYQLLVLEKSVGERRFAMANHFTQKPILKRLKMMHKKNRKGWSGVKLIFFIPIVLLLLQAFSRPEILVEKASEFVPIVAQENEKEKWLEKWTIENIGTGVFQPYGIKVNEPKRSENNVLVILLNRNDDFLIEDNYAKKEDVKRIVEEFLLGKHPFGKKDPDFKLKDIAGLGKREVSKGLISFQHDRESSEETVNYTLKSIGEACIEIRNAKTNEFFKQSYFDLTQSQQESIDRLVPIFFNYSGFKVSKPRSTKIFLTKDGKILAWDRNYTFEKLEADLLKVKKGSKEGYRKYDYDFPFVVDVTTELGVSNLQIDKLKEIFKRCEISEVNYSSESPNTKSHPKTLIIHLKNNKIYINGRSVGIRDLKTKVENLVIQDKSIKWTELLFYEYDALSKELIKEARTELKKIEIADYKERYVPVMENKKI